jgi:hypothetical protein
VGLNSTSEVLVKNADQLRAKSATRAHGTGHGAEETALGKRHNGAQDLFGLAFRESNHRLANDRNALFVSEALRNLLAVDESDQVLPLECPA